MATFPANRLKSRVCEVAQPLANRPLEVARRVWGGSTSADAMVATDAHEGEHEDRGGL